jgi:dephospho-CoA kinase
MLKIGLTGSIGMGKSTTVDFLKKYGVAAFNADQTVHRLYQNPNVDDFAKFSDVIVDGQVDRQKLSKKLIDQPMILADLEKIVHPFVEKAYEQFILNNKNHTMIVYDLPLLFEKNKQAQYDLVIVVTASSLIQKNRVLMRPSMTEQKFNFINAQQMPDHLKRQKAHVLIFTNDGLQKAQAQVKSLMRALSFIQHGN